MQRYFIQLKYNGRNYNGWQWQKNTPNTIQQVLQERLGGLFNQTIEVTGCGRTDAGVHAEKYFAHFDIEGIDLQTNLNLWVYKFNKIIPEDIAVVNLFPVDSKAHARFDATYRKYEYRLHQVKNPFLADRSYYRYGELNFDEMNKASKLLLPHKDFSSFSKAQTQVKTKRCEIFEAYWFKSGDKLVFHIAANRFLRNMVRAIVGTMLDVGEGKIRAEEMDAIILRKNRSDAGRSVPAQGLFLTDVKYPDNIAING